MRAKSLTLVQSCLETESLLPEYYNVRASAADLTALSTVVAVGHCRGPKIPFRVGRIDATGAGPFGVPQPQQDIDTHTEIFAKAGFNTSDMITMVACGHTFGGVHGKDFPQITLNSSSTNFVHFETGDSFKIFDNAVVAEYLNGSTSNLLVVGTNVTTNSDARVFSADKNATMHSLTDPAIFQAQCASILTRMIEVVPAAVSLSDPIDPIPIKPYIDSFALVNATHIALSGRIRVLTDFDIYDDQVVHLTYVPARPSHNSSPLNTTIATDRFTFQSGITVGLFSPEEVFSWHEFDVVLPADSSIKGFDVTVTRKSTGEAVTYNNAGSPAGYALDDALLYLDKQSCLSLPSGADSANVTIEAAVRKEIVSKWTNVGVEVVKRVARQGTRVPALVVERWEEAAGAERKVVGDWVVVQVEGQLDGDSVSTTFDIVVGEGWQERRVEFQRTNELNEECGPAL